MRKSPNLVAKHGFFGADNLMDAAVSELRGRPKSLTPSQTEFSSSSKQGPMHSRNSDQRRFRIAV